MLNFEEEKRSELQKFYGNREMNKYYQGGSIDDAIAGSTERQERKLARQGLRDERKELRANETPGDKSARRDSQMALAGAGMGMASTAIDTLDTDDKYGAADVASSTLKYASMGAVAGPWGAAAGAAVGFGIGMVEKGKADKAAVKAKSDKEQTDGYDSYMKSKDDFSGYREGGVIKSALLPDVSANTIDTPSQMTGGGVSSYLSFASKSSEPKTTFKNGGETKGAYSHSKNPLTVVDKKGKPVGMELTGGEGVFDKPAMNSIKKMAMAGDYAKLGQYVEKEMNTWKHK
tara:strand:+ start:6255 stop:7121 length:867 start_codon:yes stop_codon:yes gene_type:complete